MHVYAGFPGGVCVFAAQLSDSLRPHGSDGKKFNCNQGYLGYQENLLEKGMATQYSILVWIIPWTRSLDNSMDRGTCTLGYSPWG